MLSKKKLFEALSEIMKDPTILELGLKHSRVCNETYGKKSCVYFTCDSPEQRAVVEQQLHRRGFKVNFTYWRISPMIEVQVSYFKGHHWDE